MVTSAFLSLAISSAMFVEGLGITFDRQLFLWFYIILPAFLFIVFAYSTKQVRIPPLFTLACCGFFVFSGISAFLFSLDKQSSIESYLLYVALFLIFIFSYNNKSAIMKILPIAVPILGILYIGYSVITHQALHEKQVVFPYYGSHNHLGDFLGLAIIMLTVTVQQKKSMFVFLLLLAMSVFMLFSFSRSAYLAFSVILLAYFISHHPKINRRYLYAGALILACVLIFTTILSIQDIPATSVLFTIQKKTQSVFNLQPREMLSGRETYYDHALQTISDKPLFGVGAGNFVIASHYYNKYNFYSDSAHNIFLETAAEQGIPALLFLLLMAFLLSKSALTGKSAAAYGFLYLLLNFQTDYTYQIYFFLVLAALHAGASYEEKKSVFFPVWIYGIISITLFAVSCLALTSVLFLRLGLINNAISVYPLNKWAYIKAIQSSTGENEGTLLISRARKVADNNMGIMLAGAEFYLARKNKKDALRLYERIYEGNRFVNFSVIKKIYFLKKELYSAREADAFLGKATANYKYIFVKGQFRRDVTEFCIQNRGKVCGETEWYHE